MRGSLQWLIESVGMKVQTYESAQAFLDAYYPGRAGCLLLDVRMPGMNGLDLQNHLAASGRAIPIVFITAHENGMAKTTAMAHHGLLRLLRPIREATGDRT